MNAGLHVLGWWPDRFWSATPLELMAAIRPHEERRDQPNRATLEALCYAYPDLPYTKPKECDYGSGSR